MTQANKTTRIPAGYAKSIYVNKGQFIVVIDIKGGQCVDFWAIDAYDFDHNFSPPHSIVHIGSLQPNVGDQLLTNRRQHILTVVYDEVKRHDMLYPACDKARYANYFGIKDHRNCHDNFLEAVADLDWGNRPVPYPPLNIFMNTSVGENGIIITEEPLSKAGDKFILKAEMDLICVLSSCPIDLTPTGGKGITDVEVLLLNDLEQILE